MPSELETYDAFISYSRHDIRVARWLQQHIQARVIPAEVRARKRLKRRTLDRVFRDETDLASHAALSDALKAALRASKYLIVVCSPYAVASEYVNQEIKYFKELERADRILTIIVGGEPDDSGALQCIPPALRAPYGESVPLAADLRSTLGEYSLRDGDRIVAGLLGVTLRDLESAQLRTVRRRQATIMVTAMVALVAGVIVWDAQFRNHIAYYRGIDVRGGVRFGTGSLSRADARLRTRVFEVHTRGRQGLPHRIEMRNGSGGWPEQPFSDPFTSVLGDSLARDCHAQPAFTLTIDYREGRPHQEIWLNPYGLEYEKVLYADAPALGEFREGSFGCSRTPSGIKYVRFEYDNSGYEVRRQFLNDDRKPARNAANVYGYEFRRNLRGLIHSQRGLDADGSPRADRDGVYERQFEYDANGEVTIERSLDKSGDPMLDRDWCAERRFSRDRVGNIRNETCHDADGELSSNSRWFASVAYEYDQRGNVASEELRDVDGKPTLGKDWWARREFEHDNLGRQVRITHSGANGTPTDAKRGAEVRIRYDDMGGMIAREHLSHDGKPFRDLATGTVRTTTTIDRLGRVTETRYWASKGEPDLDTNGVARAVYRWNDRGQRAEARFYDKSGNPTNVREGNLRFAGWVADFDRRGNETRSLKLGLDFRPQFDGTAIALEGEWSAGGDLVRIRSVDSTGTAVVSPDGVAESRFEHDSRGNVTRVVHLDASGRATTDTAGSWGSALSADERGNMLRLQFLNHRGEPGLTLNWDYDARNLQVSVRMTDAKGQPSPRGDGVFGERRVYDHRGLITRVIFLDRAGRAMRARTGEAGRIEQHNERGELVQTTYVDGEGEPTLSADGYSSARQGFDSRGNVVSVAYFLLDGRAALLPGGFSVLRSEYDDRGHEMRQWFLDAEGRPVVPAEFGYYATSRVFDERGNVREEYYWDSDGGALTLPSGEATRRYTYDSRDRVTRTSYFGGHGQAVSLADGGFHAIVDDYDEWDRLRSRRYLDSNNRPIVSDWGYAGRRQCFDGRGNEVSRLYFGVDGAPALRKDVDPARSIELRRYSALGSLEFELLFNAEGLPVETAPGRYGERTEYDEEGREIGRQRLSIADLKKLHLTKYPAREQCEAGSALSSSP